MGLVGTIERTAILSWCPTQIRQGDLFVVASYGGSVDPGFDSGSILELHSLGSQSNSRKVAEYTSQGALQKLCSLSCEEKFLKLSWGRKPNNEELGLVAGGFSSGVVKIWDVDKLTSRTSNTPLFSSDRKETKASKGPISALEFSPFISGLLASSGSDSEFYIWDLSLSKPMEERQVKGYSLDSSNLFRGATGASNVASAELTTLTWNKGNQRILATGHVSGLCVIWDLSQKRSVVSFRDSDTKKRISCLSWSPVVPVQIVTGSDDDKGSSLFIWDLRATKVPMKDLSMHARGITSVSWCSHDSNLIICCTKDGRCIILHSQTGELLGEVPAESGWNFDVQWSNTLPGLISVCSLESKVSIWNVVTGSNDSTNNMQATSSALKDSFGEEFASGLPPEIALNSPHDSKRSLPILGNYAPSWMRRRSSASFGFDGSLLYFGVSAAQPSQTSPSFVELQQIHTNPDVLSTNHRIQEMLSEGRLQSFCMEKVRERSSKKDWRTSFGLEVNLDIWEAITLWCSSHPRQELLSHLQKSSTSPVFVEETPGRRLIGYAMCPSICSLSDIVPKPFLDASYNVAKGQMNDPVQQQPSGPAPWELDRQDDETNIQSPQGDIISSQLSSQDLETKSAQDGTGKSLSVKLVEYLLQGSLSSAVDAAFSDDRPADALILASVGGVELFRNTRIKYLEYQDNATLAFIVACVEEQNEAVDILKRINLSDSEIDVFSSFNIDMAGSFIFDIELCTSRSHLSIVMQSIGN
ncbi:Protein transport protein Sec31A [Galdieria sulphuraria]|nr:Protein transport protein Sec31A [Galdieria sulphuraria]